jgi:hypothetical protein
MTLEMIEVICSTLFWCTLMFCLAWVFTSMFKAAASAQQNVPKIPVSPQNNPLMKALLENLEKKDKE